MPTCEVVIVNYRTCQLVIDCLQSLHSEIQPGMHVTVVENASGDDSFQQLDQFIHTLNGNWVSLVAAPSNAGYAAGNNVALRRIQHAWPDYVLLLNPDTVVRPDAIRQLIQFAEQHPKAGILGSRLEDPDGTLQRSAFRFPSILAEFEDGVRIGLLTRLLARFRVPMPPADQPHRCGWVAGASMLVRREVFEQIGLLDEGYFLYYEETDFCYRAHQAGWECWYVPASRVVHLVGQSTGVTNNPQRKRRPQYWYDSRMRYFRRNHGRTYNLFADLAFAIGFGSWRCRRRLQRKPDPDPPHQWWDFVRHSLRNLV